MRRATLARVAFALLASVSIHGAILAALREREEPVLVAGGGTDAAMLGNSFEDLAMAGGILQPVDGDEMEPAEAEKPEKPVEIAERMAPRPVGREEIAPVSTPEAARPVEPQPQPTAQAAAPLLHPLEGSTEAPALAPGEVAALPVAPQAEKSILPEPSATVAPPPAEIVPAATADRIEAEDAAKAEPAETARAEPAKSAKVEPDAVKAQDPSEIDPVKLVDKAEPVEKPVETARLTEEALKPSEEEIAPPAQVEKPKKKTLTAKPKKQLSQGPGKGAADRDAIRGSAEGSPDAVAASKSKGKGPAGPGNASVSNYPGQVYAKIRRTRQKRVGGRGVVRVAFTITSSGSLGSVSVSKGSGAATIDQAAIDHVRRSAPFPAPPPGAQTNFVIPIEVRG